MTIKQRALNWQLRYGCGVITDVLSCRDTARTFTATKNRQQHCPWDRADVSVAWFIFRPARLTAHFLSAIVRLPSDNIFTKLAAKFSDLPAVKTKTQQSSSRFQLDFGGRMQREWGQKRLPKVNGTAAWRWTGGVVQSANRPAAVFFINKWRVRKMNVDLEWSQCATFYWHLYPHSTSSFFSSRGEIPTTKLLLIYAFGFFGGEICVILTS